MLERLAGALIRGTLHVLTGVQAHWRGCGPTGVQRVYFANHSSHADFVLIWTALPAGLRRLTRPVAARDYWSHGALRQYLIHHVFRGVLISRGIDREHNPIADMGEALKAGSSLILFPEGTRGAGGEVQAFKPGIHHLAQAFPNVELVPVWLDNAYRVMPKGALLPVPLLCSVTFGDPIRIGDCEPRAEFLERLRLALTKLENA
jgi:1-acyl-sn-glycerol-3-phosphate acyltransferase